MLLCRRAVSLCHFVIQILEKVHTGFPVTEQALRQSMRAAPAIIAMWRYAYVVRLNKDMKTQKDKAFSNKMDPYDLLCTSAISTTERMLHFIQW